MKHILHIITISLASILSLASCDDKDFLEENPKTFYTKDNAFSNSSQVDDQLTMAYNATYLMHGFGTLFGNLLELSYPSYTEYYGGTAASTLGGYGSDCLDDAAQRFGGSNYFSNFATLNSNTLRFNQLWNSLYKLVSYGNLALYGVEKVEWSSEEDKEYAVAQAKFFIGWGFLRLGECFGGVPIVEEFNEKLKYDYVRNSREDVYRFAIECLKTAVSGLPDHPKEDGRVAKGAASHYLAEAYLALGTEINDKSFYDEAIKAADVTIALNPLMTNRFGVRSNSSDTGTSNDARNYRADGNVFYDLFQIGNYDYSEGNTEGLWVMETPTYAQYSAYGGNHYYLGTQLGQPYRDLQWSDSYATEESKSPWAANIDNKLYPGGSGCAYLGGMSWGTISSNDYIDEYIWSGSFTDDMRNSQINVCDPVCLDTTHRLYGKVVTKDMLMKPVRHARVWAKVKMQDEWGYEPQHIENGQHSTQWGRDWYAARSAETYLIKAEAQLRNGNAGEAAQTVNVLRERAKCSYKLTASDMTLYTIVDERARELAWEEHRWPTLLRMGSSLNGGSNEVLIHQLKNHTFYYSDLGNAAADIKWTLFPIPETVIQLNTDAQMDQNPGW